MIDPTDESVVFRVADMFCELHFRPDVVISGGCRGADAIGERWARRRGIEVRRYLPEWDVWGKGAGPRRNQRMVDDAHGLAVVRYGDSRGSADVLRRACAKQIPAIDVVIGRGDYATTLLENYSMPGLGEEGEV